MEMTEELAKELALVTAFILHNDLLHGTVMQTFDKAYEYAKGFVEKYPLDTVWGIDVDLEYEEIIIYYINNNLN